MSDSLCQRAQRPQPVFGRERGLGQLLPLLCAKRQGTQGFSDSTIHLPTYPPNQGNGEWPLFLFMARISWFMQSLNVYGANSSPSDWSTTSKGNSDPQKKMDREKQGGATRCLLLPPPSLRPAPPPPSCGRAILQTSTQTPTSDRHSCHGPANAEIAPKGGGGGGEVDPFCPEVLVTLEALQH